MFTFPGNSKNAEHSVHSTGVPLSERFKSVPSHNPFRPNVGVKRVVKDYDDDTELNEVLSGPSNNNVATFGSLRGNRSQGLGLGGGINKLAVLKASKDAEILRLRAELRISQMKLKRLGNGGAKFNDLKTAQMSLKNRLNNAVRRRGGGGVIVGQAGQQLTLQSTFALAELGLANGRTDRVLRDPLKHKHFRSASKKSSKDNFFGSPKSKEDLDDELEKYMSKSKSKQKTDLDTELDEYMKHAKAQSFAGKVGLIPLSPSTPPAIEEPEDSEMEIVESL